MKAPLWRWGAWPVAPGAGTARLRAAMLISAALFGAGSAVAQITGTGQPNTFPTYDLLGRVIFADFTLKF